MLFAAPGMLSKGEVNTRTPLSDMGPETTSLAIEFRNSSMEVDGNDDVVVVVVVSASAAIALAPASDTSVGEVSCSHSARLVPHSRTPTASPFDWCFVMVEWSGRNMKRDER